MSLTSGTGCLCQTILLASQIIRPTFLKNPNDELSYRNFQTENRFLEHTNIIPQVISPTLDFRPQLSTLVSPFQKSRSSLPGA